MNCDKCGKPNSPQAKFCGKCGFAFKALISESSTLESAMSERSDASREDWKLSPNDEQLSPRRSGLL
jgi:uncharacterized membrane protein YvbJ